VRKNLEAGRGTAPRLEPEEVRMHDQR
jgi:hypothetical protein